MAFEHVSFRYRPDEPLIEDLSLVAEPGQTVAIVGPTGAGKTTLVNLIMRFYELDGGRITLDGVDIATMTPRRPALGRSGWCCRTPGCSAARSATTSPTATRPRPRSRSCAAAQATYVDRFVRSLPDGYDTVIDEEGSNVCAGEKQLITIARAFLADPSLLILDEATSSVDTRTEVLVQRAMAALRTDRTSFVIAHRLSTIRDADLILVMEAGRDRRAGHPRGAAGRARRLLAAVRGPVRRERHLVHRDAITAALGGAAGGGAVPGVGGAAGRAGGRERVGQPHVPPRRRADRPAAHRGVVRGGGREGAHVAAAPGAAPAAADPGARGAGSPGAGYPWPWSVRRWIDGRPPPTTASPTRSTSPRDLARFLVALWGVDAAGGPAAGAHSFHRGGALAVYDDETRAALATLGPRVDAAAATRMWDDALAADVDRGAGLVPRRRRRGQPAGRRGGRLAAVIDFGTSGVGDPACDLVIAWTLFDGASRAAFVEASGGTTATWARARGWALWKALITWAAPDAAPRHVDGARRTVARLLA